MQKPKRLNPGDTVAVVSPSSALASVFPHVYEEGVKHLQNTLSLNVKVMPNTLADTDSLYLHPERRADDINAAFADKDVAAIITTIGGDDSVRILKHLDLDLIRANPKILMGYSDATTLLTYLNLQGMVMFHGPAIMAGFAQLGAMPTTFVDHVRTLLMTDFQDYSYQSYEVFAPRYADWNDPANAGQVESLLPESMGWQWIQGKGRVQGPLFGGCIEVLEWLKGTPYWPKNSFWDGRMLFFETTEEIPSIEFVQRWLRNYGIQGVFDRINGILFGRAHGYSDEHKIALVEMIRNVLTVEFDRPDLPVVANLDFGHTDPQWILPLGVQAEIDHDSRTIRLLECPTIA